MPDWAHHVRPRLSSLRLSPTRENEIVEELSQHLEDRWRELRADGASTEEATQLALADFRDEDVLARYMAPLRQAHTPAPITPGTPTRFLPADLWRDFRHAARMLRKQPGFAGAAILTLALAIGATTAIFAVVDAVLLRSLPFPEAHRLVQIVRAYPGGFANVASIPKFVRWRKQGGHVFADVAAYNDLGSGFNLSGAGTPERLIGSHVSAAFFDVMGAHPSLGRVFREDEDVPGGPKLVVLSHALWKNRFGGSVDVVGQAITLNSEPYTVIGVMPEGFHYPTAAQLWTLFQFDPASRDRANNFLVVARLKPDTTLDRARAVMEIAANNIRREIPDLMQENESVGVRPLRDTLYGGMRQPLLILLASVGFVLLIACVNVANLQVAQTAGRDHEIAVRAALGANTTTIVRQFLVESVLLAAIGGLAGVAVAYVGVPAKANVFALFVRQALVVVAVGVAVGLTGALGLTRVLRSLLTGISTTDAWVFALGPAVMLGIAVVAVLRPALRAAAVDPARALRAE